jgi:hypothetical protein
MAGILQKAAVLDEAGPKPPSMGPVFNPNVMYSGGGGSGASWGSAPFEQPILPAGEPAQPVRVPEAIDNAVPAPTPAPAAMPAQPQAATPQPQPTMDVSGVLGQAAGPQAYKPGEDSLVSGQLSKLLSSDSPYMARARARAMEMANSRGLMNSSIAATAGEAAAIDAAMPIAQADASAFLGSQRDNTSAANQFGAQNNQFRFQSARDDQQGVLARQMQERDQAFTAGRDATQFGYQTQRDTAQFDQRIKEIRMGTEADLERMDRQFGLNLASSYRTAAQSTYDGYLASVTEIQQSDMDPDVKAAQIASLQSLFQTRQTFLNTVYRSAPQWSSEWSQVALEFGGP